MTSSVAMQDPIVVHFVTFAFSGLDRMERTIEYSEQTPRQLLALWPSRWGGGDLVVVVNGAVVASDLDGPVAPGSICIVTPRLGFFGLDIGAIVINAIIATIIATAINFGIQAIIGKPKVPRLHSDQESPTYDARGIRTTYGQGSRINVLLGRHRLGGQVVASNAYEFGVGRDIVALLVSLGEGQLTSIAGLDLTTRPEINDMGGLYNANYLSFLRPAGLRINGSDINLAESSVCVRSGTIWQTPVPRWTRSTTLLAVAKPLTWNVPQTFTTDANVDSARVRIHFDALFYAPQGFPVQLTCPFTYRFRLVGDPNWSTVQTVQVTAARRTGFMWSFPIFFPSRNQWEIEVTRQLGDDGPDSASTSTWDQLVEGNGFDFSFPRRAMLSLEFVATQQVQGTEIRVSVPADGPAVLWKTGGTWQARAFTAGASVPGRNPAWLAYELLTNVKWGLGRWIKSTDLDESSFEQWGGYCDELVDDGRGGTHPRHQCDLNIDDGESAQEKLLRICRTGQAIPIWNGRQIKIKFEHPDSVSFPRPVVAVFAEADVADVTVSFRDTRNRPSVLQAQILNEETDYTPDVVELPDPGPSDFNGNVLLPIKSRRDLQDLMGVTRPQHARRLLAFQHGVNRLWYASIEFTKDVDSLLLEVGDLFLFEHQIVKPFDEPSAGYRTSRAGAATTNVYLDHAVTLAPAKTYQVCLTGTDGLLHALTITAPPGTYAIDTAIAVGASVDYHSGAVAAFGELDKIGVVYECTSLTLDEDMKRQVRGVLYDEAAFDAVPTGALAENYDDTSEDLAPTPVLPSVTDATIVLDSDGTAAVAWSVPPEYRAGVRVYWRPKSTAAALPTDAPWAQEWVWLYEGSGTSTPGPTGLQPGEQYEIAVCVKDSATGEFAAPGSVTPLTATVGEFPALRPARVQGLRAAALDGGQGVLLTWQECRPSTVDYFEVRKVTPGHWMGGQLVARTILPCLRVEDLPPQNSSVTYAVAAREHSGLYGDRQEITLTFTSSGVTELDNAQEGSGGTWTGTATDLVVDADGRLVIDTGKFQGTYETGEIDAGSTDLWLLGLHWHGWAYDQEFTVSAMTFAAGSGEAWWHTLEGREPTYAQPGVDFDETVADATWSIDPRSDRRVCGPRDSFGLHTRVLVEYAISTGGAYGSWLRWTGAVQVRCRKIKFRLTLQRSRLRYQVLIEPTLRMALSLVAGAAAGPQGPQGERGPQGIPGEDGADGERGPAGPAGAPGLSGPSGRPGLDGDDGDQGPAGARGQVGERGPTGCRGLDGADGDDGGTLLWTPQRPSIADLWHPSDDICYHEPFLHAYPTEWSGYSAGGGASYMVATTTSKHSGVYRTSSGGSSGGSSNSLSFEAGLILKAGTWLEMIFLIGSDSVGTVVRMGFSDLTTGTADAANAAILEYAKATSANWRFRCGAASTYTSTTSSVAVTFSTWHKLRIFYSGTSLEFFVDGVSLGTALTTNIPTAALGMFCFVTQATAGAYTYCDLDDVKLYIPGSGL